jgi:hypothetical protein
MIVLLRKRIMSSWANLRSVPAKKKEQTIRYYFASNSSDYAASTLGFLYSLLYTQRSAEPFYVYDSQGYFQPILQGNPVVHYLKEIPATGTNLVEEKGLLSPVLSPLKFTSLKRNIQALYEFNSETKGKIDAFLANFGVIRQKYDVGLVLSDSTDVANAFGELKKLQKRLGKKTLNIFVATESIDLLREFATGGDPSWSYMSLLRYGAPTEKDYLFLKTLADITLLQTIEYLAVNLSSPLGKLLYLTNEKITTESQIISLDKSVWKVME